MPSSSNSDSIGALPKLQHGTFLRYRNKVRIQLKFIIPLPPHTHPQPSLPPPPLLPLRNPKLQTEHDVRDSKHQLRHRHIPSRTHARANQKRRPRPRRLIHRALRIAGPGDPALRREAPRRRERRPVVQRVHAGADRRARRHQLAIDQRAARPHDAPRRAAERRAEAERLGDGAAQQRARAQRGAGRDRGGVGECGAELGGQRGVRGRVPRQVEQRGRQRRRRRVGACARVSGLPWAVGAPRLCGAAARPAMLLTCYDQHGCFHEDFRERQAFARFWILRVEDVLERVFLSLLLHVHPAYCELLRSVSELGSVYQFLSHDEIFDSPLFYIWNLRNDTCSVHHIVNRIDDIAIIRSS